jgi:hypothetical protein
MGTSIPKDAPRRKWFQWYHLYFFLAAFDVLTISASLYLNHTVLAIYSDSVQQNSVWSNRVSHYSRLNDLAAAVNAPGNDVFDIGQFFQGATSADSGLFSLPESHNHGACRLATKSKARIMVGIAP